MSPQPGPGGSASGWRGRARGVFAQWQGSGLTATALGAMGFAAGVAVCRIAVDHTARSSAFADSPQFSVWCVVTGFEVALWVLCGLSARGVDREVKARLPAAPVWPFAVVVVALLIAARIGLLLYPVIRLPLYGMQIRQNLLQIGAVTAAVPALSSTWRVQTWLRGARGPRGRPPARPGQMISDLLFVRDTLRHLLLLFSLMIGGIVVATGALRSAYLADAPAESDFPAAGVLLFGGLFTAMLALLFVPVYADLRALQRRVRDSLSRIPRHGRPTERWYTQRERLTGLLELDSGVLDALRVATLVLGPFIGALATLFVPDLRL